jgi:hypothetical protein
MNFRSLGATVFFVLFVAACSSDDNAGSSAAGDGGATSGHRATLTLTGAWTYSGEFTGRVVCFWNRDGHFEFEGQAPYLVDVGIESLRDGTFDIPDYTKVMTGQITDPPGNPRIRVSRLEKVGDPNAANYAATSGTITISGSGANGTAKWSGTWAGTGVNAELHWESCEQAQ